MYSFPNFKPVCCSMPSSNCCFLISIQISQEAGKVDWYFHLFKNFVKWQPTLVLLPREFQKNIYFCFTDYAKAFDCVAHNKPW